MFKWLANKLLLVGKYDKSNAVVIIADHKLLDAGALNAFDEIISSGNKQHILSGDEKAEYQDIFQHLKNNSATEWIKHSCEIEILGEKVSQKYFIYNKLDSNKDTIILWPGNVGTIFSLGKNDDISKKYNIIIPEYLGYPMQMDCLYRDNNGRREYYYRDNIPKKCRYLQFDHVVEAAEKVTEKIRDTLKELYSTKCNQESNKKIILSGTSMGSMVAMKVAARNEQKRQPPFKCVQAIAPVINMKIASQRFLQTLPQLISNNCDRKPKEVYFVMRIAIFLIYSILFSAIFGMSYAIFKCAIQSSQKASLEYSAIVAVALPIIFISLFLVSYFYQAEKIGVNKQDIENLTNQQVCFTQVEGDQFCDIKKLEQIVKEKNNVKLTYITRDTSSKAKIDNITYTSTIGDVKLESCVTKDPGWAHNFLNSSSAMVELFKQADNHHVFKALTLKG